MSDDPTGEDAPPDSVPASSERPTSRNDEGTGGSSPPTDETSPTQVEAHTDCTNSPLLTRKSTVAVQRDVCTLHVDHDEIVSNMPPLTLPPAKRHRVDDGSAVGVEPDNEMVVSELRSSS